MVLCQPVRAPDDKILDQLYWWYVMSMECWEEDGGGGGGVGMQTSLLYVPALGSNERQLYLQDKGGLT